MVERPIKKSERQATSAADPSSTTPEQPSTSEGSTALPDGIKSSAPRPTKKGDAPKSTEKRGKRNDRGKKSEKTDAPPVNPALMRGPRPPKPSAAKPESETPAEPESSESESEF
ncbi:hypothetical protein LEP3755_61510 [Leptolyngbya sp. NIES-3755]|nr:hypothetical protein LEP3755_61510 [Leptolyngbya sp. NIES-3755]